MSYVICGICGDSFNTYYGTCGTCGGNANAFANADDDTTISPEADEYYDPTNYGEFCGCRRPDCFDCGSYAATSWEEYCENRLSFDTACDCPSCDTAPVPDCRGCGIPCLDDLCYNCMADLAEMAKARSHEDAQHTSHRIVQVAHAGRTMAAR